MMTHSTHYRHSGKAPAGGVLLTLVGGIIAGAVMGAAYGFLIYWSPFVYINAILTFALGVGLAMAVGGLGAAGKIRNDAVITIVALIVSATAFYTHWVVWVERMTEIRTVVPGELWSVITAVAELGPWTIFEWTPTGTSLYAIWGLEALIVVGVGTVSARGGIDMPFCEDTGQWATEQPLNRAFEPIDPNRAIDTPQSVLDVLQPASDPGDAFTEVTVATAEGSDLRCVSLKAVAVERKDDKEEKNEIQLVKNMLFDRDSFEKLLGIGRPSTA